MKTEKVLKILLTALCAALGIAAAWFVLRFLLVWLLPFILAFFTAALLDPVIRKLASFMRVRRGYAAAVCVTGFIALLAALAALLISRAVYELTSLAQQLPDLISGIPDLLHTLESRIDGLFSAASDEAREYLDSALEGFGKKAAELPAELSARVLDGLSSAASAAPRTLLFTATYAISVFFMSADFPAVKAFCIRQLPAHLHGGARRLKSNIFTGIGKWLKAEALLMCITFGELSAAFLLMRIDYALTLALIIAVIDALPVLGTGTVLIPWALIALAAGQPVRAVTLLAVYGVVSLVRSFLEPKLVGRQLGLHPLATLMAMYVGFSCIGIPGMLLFPMALLVLRQLDASGSLRLWKHEQ